MSIQARNMRTNRILTMYFVMLAFSVELACAFLTGNPPHNQSRCVPRRHFLHHGSNDFTARLKSDGNDEEEGRPPFSLPIRSTKQKSKPAVDDEYKPFRLTVIVSRIGMALYLAVSYFFQVIGIFFTCGLLLNLCGYGYRFEEIDGHRSFRVDTLQKFREEKAFQRAMNEMSTTSKHHELRERLEL